LQTARGDLLAPFKRLVTSICTEQQVVILGKVESIGFERDRSLSLVIACIQQI
jgi:hypothetical protein